MSRGVGLVIAAQLVYSLFPWQQPVIDSSSDEGEILEHLEGNIEFSDVVFHYPARPNVTVSQSDMYDYNLSQTLPW